MTQKEILKLIKQHHWIKFLTRPYTPLFLSMHINLYCNDLKDLINTNFKSSILLSKKEITDIYRDQKDTQRIEKKIYYYLTKNHKKIEQLITESNKAEKQIKKIIQKEKHSKPNFQSFAKNFYIYSKLFVRLTTIPYYLGIIIENELNPNDPYYKKILQKIKKFRLKNPYKYFEKYALKKHLKEFAKKHKLTLEQIDQLTFSEITQGKVNKKEINKRKKQFIYIYFNNQEYINANKNFVQRIDKLLAPKIAVKTRTVKGKTAQPGKVTGTVQIIHHLKEIKKFKKNNILISTSTNPESMPAIKKARAIITDEGGIICHAAIISRELKIPCIVGTKIATQILKNGDKIEVDATRGVIKKL